MPYHATAYEPPMPTTANSKTNSTFGHVGQAHLLDHAVRQLVHLGVPEADEVVRDGDGDERKQHQQELALLDEVGLASLVDGLGNAEHRVVRRQLVNLRAQVKADAE